MVSERGREREKGETEDRNMVRESREKLRNKIGILMARERYKKPSVPHDKSKSV